jgi:transcriptional regulator with XRE-family HTH domain
MKTEPTEKLKKRHLGRNVRRIRRYLGVKQGALAADLGISQPEISKIERQDEIEEELLARIGGILGIPEGVIRNFDEAKAINNINNITENPQESIPTNPLENDAPSVTQQFTLVKKIIGLYGRLLQSEREKIELLNNQ